MPVVTIKAAKPADKLVIANLIQLYLHDMTEFMPFPVGADGRYEYDFLDRFWRYPYFVMSDDEIAGFALVVDQCPLTGLMPCWFMAEFFVLKAYRRKGVARSVVDQVVACHTGSWHVAVPFSNTVAREFWPKALAEWAPTTRDIQFDGDDWKLHAFESLAQ